MKTTEYKSMNEYLKLMKEWEYFVRRSPSLYILDDEECPNRKILKKALVDPFSYRN